MLTHAARAYGVEVLAGVRVISISHVATLREGEPGPTKS
jgi:hypothetical protein